MKNNYPIKYAVMPMVEQVGWIYGLNELEREYEEACYIASKCFVVAEKVEYLQNGEAEKSYEVVFPFESLNYDGSIVRKEPTYNINGYCNNCTKVNKVFDTFAEAKKEALKKNEKLLYKAIGRLAYSKEFTENVKKEKEEYYRRQERYETLEKKIQNETKDLLLNAKSKEQSVILMMDGKPRILNASLYNFMIMFDEKDYCVYTVTEEEFNKLKKTIELIKMVNEKELQTRPFLENNPVEKKAKLFDIDSDCQVGNYYIKNREMSYKKDDGAPLRKEHEVRVYTMETFEDVFISHYLNCSINKEQKEKELVKVLQDVSRNNSLN